MNFIKKISFVAVLASCLCAGSAAAQTMNVVTTDGKTVSYNTSDIKEVLFSGTGTTVVQQGDYVVSVSDVTSSSAVMTVTPPDNNVRYYYDVCRRETYEKYGVSTIIEDFLQEMLEAYPALGMASILDWALSQGEDSDSVLDLPSGTEMIAYAVTVNAQGKCTGNPTIVSFKTLPAGDPSKCTFDIKINDVASDAVYFSIYPSDNSVNYWAGVCAVDMWPGDKAMPYEVQDAVREYAAEIGYQYEHLVEAVSFRGALPAYDESGLQNDTRYYLYCYAWDKQGNPLTDITKVMFTTTLYDYSDADLNISYRYFNCDELAKVYPDKFDASVVAGRVLVQTSFTLNESAAHYAWALGSTNYMDEEMYPDDATMDAILIGGFVDRTPDVYANWGEATYLYFASDFYGIDGRLRRLKVNFTKDGASPASQYSANPAAFTATPLSIPVAGTAGLSQKIAKRIDKASVNVQHFRKQRLD